jgi:hypothetical protein
MHRSFPRCSPFCTGACARQRRPLPHRAAPCPASSQSLRVISHLALIGAGAPICRSGRTRCTAAKSKKLCGWSRYVEPSNSRVTDHHVELKRTDGSATVLRIVWQMLPRNGGRSLFLLCPYCNTPRRHVYGWEWDSFSGWSNRVRSISWRCRSCARLRYSSEGGYLRSGVMFRAFGNLPRPELWLPYVFTSISDPRVDEIVRQHRPTLARPLISA